MARAPFNTAAITGSIGLAKGRSTGTALTSPQRDHSGTRLHPAGTVTGCNHPARRTTRRNRCAGAGAIDDPDVRIIGVEAGGHGVDERMEHAASLTGGRPGVLHGNRTYLLQDENGQIIETHSISAGLDYPGVGPEHAWLKDSHRAEYVAVTDEEALAAFHALCRYEGIIPALESSHALAYAARLAPGTEPDAIVE